MKRFSLHYTLLTCRFDQLWFPLAFWALFVIIGALRGQAEIVDTARAYLGAALPLVAGFLAAYAVIDDPVLELRFATPISAAQTLLERLGLVFFVQAALALSFEAFVLVMGGDFSVLGGWLDVQLAWLVPTLALMALGVLTALASAQTMTGALLVGLVWIVQLIARGWFARNSIGQYFLIFVSSLMTDHPALRANQITLLLLAAAFSFLSWRLLHRQERYI